MQNNPPVAILILNWNNYLDTKKCLDSLDILSYENYQVILVDNGSQDGSNTLIKNQYPDIILLELDENRGFAGGSNAGITYALGLNIPYILLLNNDTEVIQKDFLNVLVREIQQKEGICAVGPKVSLPDGTPEPTILPYPTLRFTVWNTLGLYNRDLNRIQSVDSIAGCCVLVRTAAIKQVGLLDENYFIYAEETEWFYRMRREGWKVLYHPVDSIIHKGAASSKRFDNQKMYIERRANVIYTLVKHQQSLQAALTAMFMIILLLGRILYSTLRRKRNDETRYTMTMLPAMFSAFYQRWNLATGNDQTRG